MSSNTCATCCSPKGKFIAGFVFWTVGLSLLIAGVTGVYWGGEYIRYNITQILRKSLVTDSTTITKDSYLNSNVDWNVYVFHVDNAAAVVSTGAKPKLVQKGPYRYKKISHKFDVSLEAADTAVKYRSWTEYQPVDQAAKTETATTINPFYVGAAAKAKGQTAFMIYATGSAYAKVVSSMYTDENAQFHQALRAMAIPFYLGAISKQNFAAAGCDLYSAFMGNCAPLASSLPGFPLRTGSYLPLSSAQFAHLWSNTSTFGMVSMNGIMAWMGMNTPGCDATCQGLRTAAATAFQGMSTTGTASGADVVAMVGAYLANHISLSDATVASHYRNTVFAVLKSLVPAAANVASVANWLDVMKLQYAYGLVSRAIRSDAWSLQEVLPAALGVPKHEFGSLAKGAGVPTVAIEGVTMAAAGQMLTYVSDYNKLGELALTMAASATAFSQLLASKYPSVASLVGTYGSDFGKMTVCHPSLTNAVTLEMRDYCGLGALAGQTADPKGGLFTTHTIHEMLFGYLAGSDPLLVSASYDGLFGPLDASQAGYVSRMASSGKTPSFYAQQTGLGRYFSQGKWITYEDKTMLMTRADLGQNCTGVADCRIWLQPEIITGSFDGVSWDSLHEDDLPQNTFPVWNSETRRVLNLTYTSPVTVKNIKMRRYVLQPKSLQSQALNSDNINYRMTAPSGIAPLAAIKEDVPACASYPHFMNADASVTANFEGLAPNPDLHNTFLDVEPWTGKTMNAAKRLQISFAISKTLMSAPMYSKMWTSYQDLYFPYLWVEEIGSIADSDAAVFDANVNGNFKHMSMLVIALLVVGAVLCSIAIALIVLATRVAKWEMSVNHMGGSTGDALELPHLPR